MVLNESEDQLRVFKVENLLPAREEDSVKQRNFQGIQAPPNDNS